jgi:antitoxin component of RelBE/YafQ-DinJ toxin-antitoxin module
MKEQSNFRLTDDAKSLLKKIARSLGLTSTAALEVIIREAAKKREIK